MHNEDKQTETNLSLWQYLTDDAAKIKDRMWKSEVGLGRERKNKMK